MMEDGFYRTILILSLYFITDGFILQRNFLTPERPTLTLGSSMNLTCSLHAYNLLRKSNYTSNDIVFAKNSDRIPVDSSDVFTSDAETIKLQIHAPMTWNQTQDDYYCYVFEGGHPSHILGHQTVDYKNSTRT